MTNPPLLEYNGNQIVGTYLKFSEVRSLQIEPTSKCNLLCPQCERTFNGKINPILPLTELTPEDYDSIFTDNLTSQLKNVIFNGSYGDPVASKYLNYAIDKLLKKQQINITLFTNGSLKNVSWWSDLGNQLSGTNSQVVFSIDGLKDTNAVYRINSNFEKIMENATAYIQSGGRARWDFLVFEHNYHQIEEAKTLAKKMGFEKFLEKKTARFIRGNYTYRRKSDNIFNKKGSVVGLLKEAPNRENNFEKILKKYGSWDKYVNSTPIHCKYRHNMKALFIDFEAFVWPCCWVGSPTYSIDSENPHKKQFNTLRTRYEKNFNSLRYHTLSEILSHSWFNSDLVQSWENKLTDKNPKLLICGRTCGSEYEFTSGPGYKNSKMYVL